MRTGVKDPQQAQDAPVADVQPTKQATPIYNRLSKAELVQILKGEVHQPLSPRELYRCAVSIVWQWCDAVATGRCASLAEVDQRLQTLQDIYENRR